MTFRLKLSSKLVGVQVFFLAVALASIGLSLFVSWRLEGNAAAINDAGSLRMRTYRLAFLASEAGRVPADARALTSTVAGEIDAFDRIAATLRQGDPARPLFVPRTDPIVSRLDLLDREWRMLEPAFRRVALGAPLGLERSNIDAFVATVDQLVQAIEQDSAQTARLLRTIQVALVALAVAGTVALIALSFLIVIRPVRRLEDGLQRMAQGRFEARLPVESSDEFGSLSEGFNRMAERLEQSYRTLEARVTEKTRSLAEQNARLGTLYDMTAYLNASSSIEELCRGFLRRLIVATGSAGGLVRLVSRDGDTLHRFVEQGLGEAFLERETCIGRNECACGDAATHGVPVIHVLRGRRLPFPVSLPHCSEAGFGTIAAFPIAAHRQVLGVYNLFFTDAREIASETRHMLESLGQHLGTAIENVRLASREREVAIAEERNLLAQELHDSIAQSLAFLNLQVQLLRRLLSAGRTAEVSETLDAIQSGVQESYADVRELLTHFRTRTSEADVEHGVRSLLARFERQAGVPAALSIDGDALPLAPDDQLQVMHILQEALSNVRKHAQAGRVDVEVHRGPDHLFVVRDDGRGFDPARAPADGDAHVGLRIMRERAEKIGATVTIASRPGRGTEITLRVPMIQKEAA
jgi:two-component system, NarL family, nitrate/nitrite sensor histidine kinase NarX